jgi:hypothetical protein
MAHNPNVQRIKHRWALMRPMRDALIAFTLFLLATVTVGSSPLSATPAQLGHPVSQSKTAAFNALASADESPMVELATARADASNAVFRKTSAGAAWILLAAAIAALCATNLAIIRHVRTAYALPSRRKKS